MLVIGRWGRAVQRLRTIFIVVKNFRNMDICVHAIFVDSIAGCWLHGYFLSHRFLGPRRGLIVALTVSFVNRNYDRDKLEKNMKIEYVTNHGEKFYRVFEGVQRDPRLSHHLQQSCVYLSSGCFHCHRGMLMS